MHTHTYMHTHTDTRGRRGHITRSPPAAQAPSISRRLTATGIGQMEAHHPLTPGSASPLHLPQADSHRDRADGGTSPAPPRRRKPPPSPAG
ncbi:hypothetical protein FKM82_026669 [Ascaphus truei]